MPVPTSDVNKHLETLGLNPDDLNEDAIRVSYKKLALQWHPDRHNADPEEAKEKFIEVNEAYGVLVEECKKRHKRRKPRKEDDSSSHRRPFWASSTSSTSSSSSSTPSASSSCASEFTMKETEIPSMKPGESRTPKPAAKSTSANPADAPRAKHSTNSAKHRDLHNEQPRSSAKTRRTSDRDTSQSSSSHNKRSQHGSSTAHYSPRPAQSSHVHPDTDSGSSSDEQSLHEHKRSHRHPHLKGKKPSLGEDDYEFIDLGSPLKPLRHPKPLSSTKDWIFPLQLTLEDLYFGAKHRYRITRTLCPPSGHSKAQTVQIDVQVAPGWRTGTRIRVSGVGNERADRSFQDIVFVVAEAPHPRFVRAGDDLVLPVLVPWADAQSRPYPPREVFGDDDVSVLGHGDESSGGGGRYRFGWRRRHHSAPEHANEQGKGGEDVVYVLGLDGEEYTLPIPRTLVEAADGTRIFGAGMPVRKNGKVVGKGDLIIRWEFAFPESDKLHRSRWQTLKDAMHLRLPHA